MSLAKATLKELEQDFATPKSGGKFTEVQFNPESLKVTFSNSLVQPEGGDQSSGSGGRQFVGAGTTKLAMQLWFDVTVMEKDPVDDVRRLTQKVIDFMTPADTNDPKKKIPPGVEFQFGTFIFRGMVEALEETIEFFSPAGKPLRASMNVTLSQQKILESKFDKQPPGVPRPGHQPLAAAKQGDSVQNMAAKNGNDDWQSVAAANGIEDPMRMPPGALIDLNVGVGVGASAGGSFDAQFGVAASADVGVGFAATTGASSGAGLNASLGGSASASLSLG